MTRKSKSQMSMYQSGKDLPLFSMTAQTAVIEPYQPQEVVKQDSLFAPKCGACLDTGKVDGKPCVCEAGNQYRKQKPDGKVLEYIRRIANPVKHDYAARYYAWICNGRLGDEPQPVGQLSSMARQAVAIALGEFEAK